MYDFRTNFRTISVGFPLNSAGFPLSSVGFQLSRVSVAVSVGFQLGFRYLRTTSVRLPYDFRTYVRLPYDFRTTSVRMSVVGTGVLPS